MEKEFTPYELAVKLKELGFDEECLTCYCKHWKDLEPYLWKINQPDYDQYWDLNSKTEAPLWQQAFDWFREKYGYDLLIKPMTFVGMTQYYEIHINHPKYVWDKPPFVKENTYEEARQACLEKLIELVENEKK